MVDEESVKRLYLVRVINLIGIAAIIDKLDCVRAWKIPGSVTPMDDEEAGNEP